VCCHKLRSSDAKAEFELKTKLYAWVEVAAAEGRKKAQKRKERCVPYDLRHAYAIRARETTSWSYADVAAVMGHSPEVHRRTYLSEISGEQTKAAVVRRLLGDEQVAQEFAENPPEKPYFFLPERRSRSDWARFQCFRGSESLISGVSQMGG